MLDFQLLKNIKFDIRLHPASIYKVCVMHQQFILNVCDGNLWLDPFEITEQI